MPPRPPRRLSGRRPRRAAWRAAGLLAWALTAATPSRGAAQPRRRLQSRAAFAALDSAQLADSSAMLPLDPHERLDSAMLAMAAYLDATRGRAAGLPPTRVRRWDGFGTQAHPRVGILVDRQEIDGLLERVAEIKTFRGVPRADVARRLEYVVRFVVAHEYAHLLQYRDVGGDAVDAPNATRVVECAADLVGGITYRSWAGGAFAPSPVPDDVIRTPTDFGLLVGASDWLDGTTHPLPDDRRTCIAEGFATAERDAPDSAPEAGFEGGSGRTTLVRWSLARARDLAGRHTVVGANLEVAVVRDTSAARAVGRLAEAAAGGAAGLRALRTAVAAPGDSTGVLLREALPAPWECTAHTAPDGAELGSCVLEVRAASDDARRQFASLAASVGRVLAGAGWTTRRAEPTGPGGPTPPGAGAAVAFGEGGGATVVLAMAGDADPAPSVQRLPASRLTVTVRAPPGRGRAGGA